MRIAKRVITTIIIGVLLALVLAPIAVVFTNSFMSFKEIDYNYTDKQKRLFDTSPYASDYFIDMELLPNAVNIEQYITLVGNPFYFHYLFNSMKLLIPIILLDLAFSLLSAYGLSQISKKLSNPLLCLLRVLYCQLSKGR